MGLDLKRIQSFEAWRKRKLLVIHMETRFLDVESCLRLASIPFYALSYESSDFDSKVDKISHEISGIIITGSRKKGKKLPELKHEIMHVGTPILGLCYGNEFLAKQLGSNIIDCNPPMGEYSEVKAKLYNSILFEGLDISEEIIVTMAHNYMVEELPKGCKLIASTKLTPIAGFENLHKKLFGLQFHPEKGYLGDKIFMNFFNFCNSI